MISFNNNISVITRLAADPEEYFLSDIIRYSKLVVGALDNQADMTLSVGDIVESSAFFLLSFKTHETTSLKEYFGTEDEAIRISYIEEDDPLRDEQPLNIIYSVAEKERLEMLYGMVEPELQITLDPESIQPIVQKSKNFPPLSYDILSSIGPIFEENITVSSDAETNIITLSAPEETISDVGGLSGAGRDRDITNTDQTVTTSFGVSSTVTTSGY
tara:strand:- start:2434 stop:3081 length:648 start_codon:yes stop_codon:yes gene_type:complete